MNAPNPVPSTRPLPLKPKWIAAGLLLLVVYLLLRPWLVERYGWDLPGFTDVQPKAGANAPGEATSKRERLDKNRPVDVPVIPEQGEPVIEDSVIEDKVSGGQVASAETKSSQDTRPSDRPKTSPTKPKSPPVAQPSEKSSAPSVATQTPKPKSKHNPTASKPAAEAPQPGWKGLKPIGGGKLVSPAGLVYDQYRIDHVMEHSRDNTDKPSHGVFDRASQDEVLALVDEAYGLAQKRGPPQVIIEDDGDRTAYTVNLNRKVGRAGGQSGARRRNPPMQKVKIVVEGDRVITAYPTN